ncbi:MAG: peptidoglycan DD-metalloendopeptidase family protein [Clostridia bacterium]
MAKKKKSFVDAVKGAANASRKGAKEAISQGKGTPVQRQKQQARGGGQSQQRKYQDGQYGQFVKNSRLGQSGAAQRNNNQKQQQEVRRKQQKNNRVASTYGELNERANERNQQRAKRQSKSAHRFENATKGTLQQTLGSHATTFYAARNPNEDRYIQSEERRKQQGEKNHSKFSEGQYGQLVKKERSGNVKEREKNLKKASELIEKGNKNIEKSKEGLGKGGKFAVDTYSAMLGMATDAAAGPFSMGSMASRSFGAAYDTAKKEGANDTQAALYGASQAAVETGTEKMFALAKPLKKLYGAGVGDDVAEKLLEKMTKKASTKAGKEVVYHGGKTAMAALSEGLEEMVSEGLEPALANQIYANATGTPHSTSAKDVLYAGAVGGAMGGILGGGGQAVEYNQGRKIQNVYGNDGLKTMAKKLRDVADEASGRAAVGELINRTIDEGQPVTSVQSRRLYQAAAQQEEADFKRQSVMNTVASNEITKNNHLNPVERGQEGNMLVGETTRQRYDESVQNIVQQVKESGMDRGMKMPDSQVDQIASAVSAIKTGVAGTNEVNMFLVANPKARTVYETITGEKLPAGNTDTKEALYARIAANRVESAKLETEAFTDRVKGGMAQDVAKTYEPSGQAAFEQMMDQADIANAVQTQNDITAFDDYYRAGRNGIAYETVAQMNHPAHQAVKAEVRKAAWEAGASDAVLAADTAKGVQMEIGKKISQSRSKGKSGAHRGKVISELSQEAKRNLPASQQRMFRQLARVFNVNIHIVDEAGFNGKYEDGEVYLSVQGDRDLPYIFSHEITHHMQDFAPVEYNELKELVRQAWAEKGGIDEAVNDKIAQYAEKDVQLTYEDALDEIIADSTYEMIQDEGFAEQMCSENRSLAQKILDAIKNVLSKLRQILAEGDGFTPAQNAALLSQLDILKSAEKLWTDGLVKAAENRDAVGVKKSGKESYSLRQFEDGQRYVEIDVDTSMFDGLTRREKGSLATKIIKRYFAGKPVGEENRIFVNGKGAEEYGFPLVKLEETAHDAKMRSSVELDNLFDAGFNFRKAKDGAYGHVHSDTVDGFGYFDVIFKVGDRYFKGVINIKNTKRGKLFKDITKIEDITEITLSSYGENPKSQFLRTSSNNSISQTSQKDNEKSHSFKGIDGENVKYSIREDDPPKKTVKGYKVFVVKNGKLYPPMVANPGGADTPVGVWLDADEGARAGESKTGRPQVKAGGKGTQGGSGKLAYRPGWHLGEVPMATQFARMNKETGEKELFPENFVWAECEVAADHDYQDEAMSYGYSENGKFRHAYAGLPRIPKDGMYRYRTNPDPSTVPWIISGSMKVTKVLSDAEVDEVLRSNATVSETAPEDKSKLWVDSSDGGTLKYWYGSKKAWRKAPVVRKGGEKTLEELGISSEKEIGTARFSLKEPVEEQGNLIAVHNIKESELMKTFKLGGFPMPSIAIVNGKSSFSEYGPISVLFSKDTIDPERSADNEVYSGDAWTPVYPTVEFKVNEKAADRIYQKVREIEKNNVPEGVRSSLNHFNPANIEDEMNRYKGEAGLFETYQNDINMKNVYLADKGEAVFDVYKKTEKHFAPEELGEIKKYIKELGGEEAARRASKEEWIKAVRKIKGIAEEKKVSGPVVFRAKNRTLKYLDTGESWIEEKYDYGATVRAIEEKTNQGEYESWLKDFFAGLEEKSGIRNNRDMFDDMGNRRSFDELHYEETLENVVRTMRQEENGGAIFAGQNMWSAATRKYEDLEDIKNDSDRLVAADQEEYDKLRNEYTERLMDITSDIMDHDTDNEFMARDNAAECVVEAVRYSTDPDEIYDYLQDFPQLTVTEENAEDIAELIEDISEMPTEYFEAKPRRAVGFDEVKAVVVPSDTTKELRAALDDAGIEATEYEAGNDEDRIAKVNEVADQKRVKFSLKDSDGRELSKAQREYFKDSKVRDEDGNLLVMYHGTPKGDFTVFRDGSYFTQNKRYADGYQNETAGRTDLDPKTYEVYLNITKPFDIRNDEEARNIYIDDYIKGGNAVGINPYMSDSEYDKIDTIDWTEGDDLKDFLIEEEYDYDGLVLDEGADGGYGEDVVYRGDSYVIFSPDQVKNVDNENPTSDSDIRYSLPDEESIMDYAADRETEFAEVPPVRDYERRARGTKQQTYNELRAQVDKLKADKKLTRGRVLDKKSVKEQINDMVVMLKSYGDPDGKKTDHKLVNAATENIAGIFRHMKEEDYAGAVNQAYNSAQDMIDSLHLVDDSMMREYKELRDVMRTTKISVSEEDAASIPDFKEWKKSQFGRLRIAKDGMAVDSFYEVLCEKYPELFDHSISHPADQLQAMADVRESMEPFDILLDSEERSDLVKQAAQDMIDIAATGKPWKSWADRKKETYDEQVKRLKQRQKEALRDVRQKSKESKEKAVQKVRAKKDEQIKAVRQKGKKKLETEKKQQKKKEQKRKAQAERRKRFERIEKNHKWLSDRLLKPTDDKHIPEEFKTAVAHLLSQIDLQTERSKNLEAKYGKAQKTIQMDDFRRKYAELAREDGTGMFEYDGYIFRLIDSLADKMNGRSIDECSDVEIAEFDTLLKAIRHNIQNYNKAFSDALNEDISIIAEETINKSQKVSERKKGGKNYGRSGAAGAIDAMLNESMVTPRDFFERLGGGMNKVFGSLRKGFDRHVDNITNARKFFDGIFTPYNKKGKPGSKIEKWRNASQSKEFEVYGGKITLNPAQIMSLYCLSKRDQAMGHILGGGIVASRVDAASKIKQAVGAKIESRGSSVMVTMEDVAKITASLTPEQRTMADRLQDYLNDECAEWGNETSMRLYGYRKFTEKNYFPIKSADTYLDSNIEGRNAEERIRNFGFTKGTVVNANNPIMIDDIFRVTADHINKMSLYNAFAAPISDFMRVYNFKARDENGQLVATVKAGLEDAYGKKALNYINNFMADVNNQVQTRTEGFGRFVNKSLANYKKATIGFNARVALQQPTAIMRAFILMNPKYFVNGSVNVKKNLQDMKAHCQTARWKSWGFSQVDMARDIDQIMMNSEWSKMDVLTMQIYGALDNVTWSYIWAAVRKETEAKHPDVQVDSEEFYRICNERAAEVFDKTQVVDSVFNRSQVMRNTDTMSKMLTSFMAEPTRTYNMMRTEFAMAKDLWNEGEKGKAIAKMNRACSVFMLNAAAVSAAAAVADAFRGRTPGDDDKDDDSLFTNFLYNFWDNVNPANMIPVAKDIWGAKEGWSIKNMALSGYESLVQAAQDFAKDPSAENARSLAEGFGLVTGLPIKNIMREMKVSFGIFGIDVFAAEEGDTGLYELDKILNSLGLGKTEQQKKERDYEKEVKSVEKAADGLTGSERQEAIWKAATEKYSTYIEDGDMNKIYEMRKVLEATGGDVDKFDKSVQSKVVTAYKKNIGEGGSGAARGALREYLLANGYTEAKISQKIVAKSDTAKKFQEALCLGDEEAEYRALGDLLDAGIYDTEIQTLYQNRVKSIDAGDYSTGEMVNPVSGQITSGFGYRSSPGGIGSTNHKGIDIAVPEGTDVAAADGGTITKVDYNGSRGAYVEVTHGNGRKTRYQHLSGYYVQKGDVVKKGQIIAASGNTGHSTGPHLHFEVLEGGTPVNPMNYLK